MMKRRAVVSGMHEANNRTPYLSEKIFATFSRRFTVESRVPPTNAAPRVTAHNTCKPHGHDAV